MPAMKAWAHAVIRVGGLIRALYTATLNLRPAASVWSRSTERLRGAIWILDGVAQNLPRTKQTQWYLNFLQMKTDHLGQMIFSEDDCVDMLMRGQSIHVNGMLVDATVDLETAALMLEHVPIFVQYKEMAMQAITVADFDRQNQAQWLMPDEYKNLGIAEYVLGLCESEAALQRVGEELLLYQARDLFDLLKYLKFLVDVMTQNNLIWGVGRGSSVSSYVLYLLKVHKIDSLHYNLDIAEFLR